MIAKTFFNLQRFTNSIINHDTNETITGSDEDDYIENSDRVGGGIVSIFAGSGNDTIYNHSLWNNSVTINSGSGNNSIFNEFQDDSIILSRDGNDAIHNRYGDNVTIKSGGGDDTIVNDWCENITIMSGSGNDTIRNYCGDNVIVLTGSGNDSILSCYGDNVTIIGGVGNDYISIDNSSHYYAVSNTIKYNYGDGKDTIKVNFTNSAYESSDKLNLQIATSVSYSTVYGGNNLYVKFDDSNSIVLTGISQSELGNLNIVTIQGGEENNSTDDDNNSNVENDNSDNNINENNGDVSSETFTYSQLTDAQKKETCENSLESLKSLINIANDVDVEISSDDFYDKSLFQKTQGWTKFTRFVANLCLQGNIVKIDTVENLFTMLEDFNVVLINVEDIITGKKPLNDVSASAAIIDYGANVLDILQNFSDALGVENAVVDLSLISSVTGLAANVVSLVTGSTVSDKDRQDFEKAFIDVAGAIVNYTVKTYGLADSLIKPFGPVNAGIAALTGVVTGFDQFFSSNAKYKNDGLATATQNAWIDAFSTGIHEAANKFTFGADDAIFEGVRWLAHNLTGKGDQYEKSDLNYMEWLGTAVKISVLGEVHGNDKDNGIETVAEKTEVVAGAGNDFIIKAHSQVTIYGGADNDTVGGFQINGTEKNYIDLGDGNDSVTVYDKKSTIYGGNGDDIIKVMGLQSDVINVYATDNKIYGNDGKDIIYLNKAISNTVRGGAGNDTIALENSRNTYIEYKEGDGVDSIIGYGESDTIRLTRVLSSYSTVESGDNVIVYVGDNNEGMILVGAKGKNINISADNTPKEEDMNVLGIKQESINGEKLRGSETSSTNNSSRNYSGGNSTITNYVSEEVINYQTDFTGIGFNNSDFMVNSSSGTLTIQNARDKLMNFAVNDNLVARAFMSSGGGKVNGSGFSELTAFIGGNDASNVLTAGSGGSSLWGGSGGADTLNGGASQDIFFFGKYDGLDVISNASSNDKVHLYDVNLSDIISANVSGGVISANFNTGGTLQINCTENLSPTFQLADSSYRYNQSSGQWQNA